MAAAEGAGLSDARQAIIAEQREIAQRARRLSMNLHNANRQRERRLDRARGLSNDDLMQIFRERAAQEEQNKEKKKKRKTSSKAGWPRATAVAAQLRPCTVRIGTRVVKLRPFCSQGYQSASWREDMCLCAFLAMLVRLLSRTGR
jgi:CO/xanthine dehydrogenase Mo-binding subunit